MKKLIPFFACLLATISLFSQTTSNIQQPLSVNSTGAAPDASAQLDVQSTTKGILVPRMTTAQRTAIASPATGLMLFDTDTGGFWFYNGSAWTNLSVTPKTLADASAASTLADADGDTKIQVEESPDEDIIRFDLDGKEHFMMDGPRLMVRNSGRSVFIGNAAGVNDDLSDNRNVAVGDSALFANTKGSSNTANGAAALRFNTLGESNTANGRDALRSNIKGSLNTANGRDALRSNTFGSSNTAIGMSALHSNTSGNTNTAIGLEALRSNTSGSSNVAIGTSALYFNTSGISNTATGTSALLGNISGSSNTATGGNALSSNTYGSDNTANGRDALLSNTIGSYNTADGMSALRSNMTGSFNTAIGVEADVNSGNLSKATAIGYNAKVGCDNCLVLGGTGVDSANVGIGTTSPINRLDVEGRVAIGAAYSGSSTAPANGLIIQGNVGIGKPNPVSRLDVNGGTRTLGLTTTSIAAHDNGVNNRTINVYGGKGDQWINFRRGGNPTGNAGLIFSDHNNEHYFLYTDGDDLHLKFSTQASEDPSVTHSSIVSRLRIRNDDGRVAIGDNGTNDVFATGYRLSVVGKIACEEVMVDLNGDWPDYVFQKDYDLKSLSEVKQFIDKNGHLPGVPSAKEVEENGVILGEMNKILLEKVEELTLYAIQKDKELATLRTEFAAQITRLEALINEKNNPSAHQQK